MSTSAFPARSRSRYELIRVATRRDDFAADVRRGLTANPKSLPPRWFYDDLGSSLFDAICFLPEYYVTRAETEVLTTYAAEIVDAFGANVRLVELGSGMARKTRILLDRLTAAQHDLEYVPVDVDEMVLERSGLDLLSDYADLRVTALEADFSRPSIALAGLPPRQERTVVLFLGSTIGNLDPTAATSLLKDLRSSLKRDDALLLGVDLRKSPDILEPAYDDALGVTAAFNLNLLRRINRELGGHFDIARFAHRAFYDAALGRIEMHLVSRSAQRVAIDTLALEVGFEKGETIHTENSHKYDRATLSQLASSSGFALASVWTDAREWFADALLIAS